MLRLLGTELDGPAIARELMVSLNTMRTHTKNIYAKLAVTNRRAAVRRAAELNLLPRTRSLTCPPAQTWRGCLRRPRPPPESPHQSPGVVMPAHHIRS